MANQTTAWGTVFITAPDEKSLIDFVYLKILSEKNAEYTTEFDELPEYTALTKEFLCGSCNTANALDILETFLAVSSKRAVRTKKNVGVGHMYVNCISEIYG